MVYNLRVNEILRIENLSYAYGAQKVLSDINLPVASSTILGVIGPNGGGKTTLIKLILGLLKPTSGAIFIDNLSPQAAVSKGNLLGYLPQAFNAPADFPISVRQLIRLGLCGKTGVLKPFAKEDLEFSEWLIGRMGLADLAATPFSSLSGGQKQRALIARALAPKPKLLLLDEPTTGIDQIGQRQFIDFLQNLKAELNLTILLVSHDLRAVTALSDRIACLNLTLHYHDVPEHLPADLVFKMFACDLAAAGLEPHSHKHDHPDHPDRPDHPHPHPESIK